MRDDILNFKTYINVLFFVYFLNDISTGGEVIFSSQTIMPKKGKLLLFPDSLNFPYTLNKNLSNDLFIISGQLSSKVMY